MSYDTRHICPRCAWRGHCAKRFAMGDDTTLHCPDFSEDVSLRPRLSPAVSPTPSEKND